MFHLDAASLITLYETGPLSIVFALRVNMPSADTPRLSARANCEVAFFVLRSTLPGMPRCHFHAAEP